MGTKFGHKYCEPMLFASNEMSCKMWDEFIRERELMNEISQLYTVQNLRKKTQIGDSNDENLSM